MIEPPPTPPGHWVQCPECLRYFENEQGRGSHRFHSHGIRSAPSRDFRFATPPVEVAAATEPSTTVQALRAPEAPTVPVPAPASPSPAKASTAPSPAATPLAPTESPPVEIAWSQPTAAPTGLSVVAQTLAHAPPPPTLGKLGRGVIVFVVFALSGLALYLVVRQLKGANAPQHQAYTFPATQPTRPAQPLTTGDAYWDSVLGYRGLRL